MHRYLSALILCVGLWASPALADDPPAPPEEAAEEATEADESAAPADEAAAPEGAEGEGEEAVEEGAEEATVEGAEPVDPAEEIAEIEEAVEDAFALIEAIKSKNWPLAVGLILMLLVFVANKLGLKKLVGPKALPWVAMGLAVAGTIGTGLIAGLGWADSIMQGILAGVVAIGGWELLLKHFLGDKKPAADEATES